MTLLPFSVMATTYGSNKFSSSISQVGLQLLIFKSRDMYKIKRLVKTGPPIEAEQTEPLKRNLDLPHKPPAKKKMTITKVDTASIFSRSQHACNSIAYLL